MKIEALEAELATSDMTAQVIDEICDIVSHSISGDTARDGGGDGSSVDITEFCRMLFVWEQYRRFYSTLDSLKQGLILHLHILEML